MVDSSTDASIAQVQSSYSDVNNALENLLGNMSSGSSYDAKAAIANLQNQLNNFVGTNPVGTVLAFTTNTIPNGYLLCNGASFDTSKYSQLYSALGSASVPDMRGLFLRGLDTTGAIDNFAGSRTILSFEEGSYYVKDPNNSIACFYVNGDTNIDSLQYTNLDARANPADSKTYAYGTSTGNGMSGNQSDPNTMIGVTRPKNIAVNYIIKAVP